MFTPIKTDRLLLRPVQQDDAAALSERRSEPEGAQYQGWTTPYGLDRAEDLVAEVMAQHEPTDEQWWMLTIVDRHSEAIIGDLAIHPTWGGRSIEVGYTLARDHWGKGYATEAVAALIRHFFENTEATRIHAMLHPENHASAGVLERTGFLYEGRTRLSYWVGDENTDDLLYGMTKADWVSWVDRPRHAPNDVELIEIDEHNKRSVSALRAHESQRRFVSPADAAMREALFPDSYDGRAGSPWLRAIQADGELVGLVLLALPNEVHREPVLWRFLIDRVHQRRGIGDRVFTLVVDECKRRGARSLVVDWTEGQGSPRPFYEARGVIATGRINDGETEGRLVF